MVSSNAREVTQKIFNFTIQLPFFAMKWMIVGDILCDLNPVGSTIGLKEMFGTNCFGCRCRKLMLIKNKTGCMIDKDRTARVLYVGSFLTIGGSEPSLFFGNK